AGTYNTVQETIEASIQDGSTVTANGGDVELTATDSSEIQADAGGVAISIAYAKQTGVAVAASIGAANANNTIKNSVSAFIDNATVTASRGVTLTAQSQKDPNSTAAYRINALAFGAAGSAAVASNSGVSLSLDGAGSSATNNIDDTIAAYIGDPKS